MLLLSVRNCLPDGVSMLYLTWNHVLSNAALAKSIPRLNSRLEKVWAALPASKQAEYLAWSSGGPAPVRSQASPAAKAGKPEQSSKRVKKGPKASANAKQANAKK